MSEFLGASVESLARLHTREAIGALVEVVRGAGKPGDRVRAAEALLDRGHGRPTQAVVSVPAKAVAARLAAMSDEALLRIAGQGGRERNGVPMAGGDREGTPLRLEQLVSATGLGQPETSLEQPAVSFGQPETSLEQPAVSFGQPETSLAQPFPRNFRNVEVTEGELAEPWD